MVVVEETPPPHTHTHMIAKRFGCTAIHNDPNDSNLSFRESSKSPNLLYLLVNIYYTAVTEMGKELLKRGSKMLAI